nr:hypothetical protein [Tanacetum cinerariifolium]
MPLVLGVNMILTLLSKDYDQLVQNYNMHGMGKTIPELHAMLKLVEKAIPKKNPAVLAIRQGQIQKPKSQARGKGKSILDKEKLNGSNFLDWYRNLRIVLRNEQKLHHLEEALPEAPPTTATAVVCNAYTCRVAEQQEVACLMLVSMTPEIQQNLEDRPAFEILQELKTMFQQRLFLGVNMILTLLSKDYDQLVQNYNMHGMGKTIPELHAMLKLVEKAIPKKNPAVLAIRQGQIEKPKSQARGKGK